MSRTELIQLNRTTYGVANNCFRYTGMSGVIAAGLNAGDVLAAFNLLTPDVSFIERIRIRVTTITAFTVPVSAGRALAVTRLTAMPAGASSDNYRVDKQNGTSANSGGVAIADTAPLAGAAVSGSPFWIIPLTHVGAAGASIEATLNFGLEASNLRFPSGVLGIVALDNFDAAGTIQIVPEIDFEQAVGF